MSLSWSLGFLSIPGPVNQLLFWSLLLAAQLLASSLIRPPWKGEQGWDEGRGTRDERTHGSRAKHVPPPLLFVGVNACPAGSRNLCHLRTAYAA